MISALTLVIEFMFSIPPAPLWVVGVPDHFFPPTQNDKTCTGCNKVSNSSFDVTVCSDRNDTIEDMQQCAQQRALP